MFSFNFFPFNAPNDINVDVFGDKNDESFFVSKPEYNIVIIKNNILFKIKMKQLECILNFGQHKSRIKFINDSFLGSIFL